MKVPFVDLKRQNDLVREEIDCVIKETIDAGNFILGKRVEEFENSAAKYLGVKYVLGVGSGSDALLLSLMAYDIKSGDEVITTPFCFIAAVEAIMHLGARPVFVDIEDETYNINVEKIEEKITEKTKAIIPVHLFGQATTMEPLLALGKKHGVPIIEDNAQSMGAEYGGKKLGSLGDIGCFSFYPTKNLSGLGDGGLITTDNEEIYQKMKALRTHGTMVKKYHHEHVGLNSRLDALQAAALMVKLPHLDSWNEKRRMLGEKYTKKLAQLVKTPVNKYCSTFNSYSVLTESRDALREFLLEKGIHTSIFYPSGLHLQECLKHLGYREGDFPIAESCTSSILSLPIFVGMTDEELDYVTDAIGEFFKDKTRKE